MLRASNLSGHVFDQVPRKKWKDHVDEKCPNCNGPRFDILPTSNGKRLLQPYKMYIDFNLQEQYLDLKYSKEVPIQRQMDAGSFFASKEAERLRQFTVDRGFVPDIPGQGIHPDIGTYEIGLDWLEPWNSVNYSTGLVIIRDCDVEARNLGKNNNWRPLLLAIGPNLQKNFQPYMMRTSATAKVLAMTGVTIHELTPTNLGPTPTAREATPSPAPPTASHRGPWLPAPQFKANSQAENVVRSFLHRALLIGVLADTPARYVHIYTF